MYYSVVVPSFQLLNTKLAMYIFTVHTCWAKLIFTLCSSHFWEHHRRPGSFTHLRFWHFLQKPLVVAWAFEEVTLLPDLICAGGRIVSFQIYI